MRQRNLSTKPRNPFMKFKLPPGDHYGDIAKRKIVAGFTLVETRYAPQIKLPRHSHERACLCLVLRGACQEIYAGRSLFCQPFSFLFRPAEEAHSDRFEGSGGQALIIEVDHRWLARLQEQRVRLDAPVCLQSSLLTGLAARLYAESRQMDEAAALSIEGLLLEVAAELARNATRGAERKAPRWLERAREFLQASYAEPPTFSEVANAVDVHPVHLAREFRRHYHCTMGEYVRRLRIEFACREISVSDAPLAEIALAAGFTHQSHFSRCFKQVMAMTPAEFQAVARSR
jgi:AraC family transcriptional regulator